MCRAVIAFVVRSALVVGGVFLGLSGSASATVTLVNGGGTINLTTEITTSQTSGSQMSGMVVTAFFAGSAPEVAVWGTTGANSGAAAGTSFQLSEVGDTFSNTWTLSTFSRDSLLALEIDAGPGNTVFDTRFVTGDVGGTPGSARGTDFTLLLGPAGLDITARYTDPVALTGNPPVGDLFRRLRLIFTSSGGLAGGSTIQFQQDTDNIRFAGDLRPVPEPATLSIACLAIVTGVSQRLLSRKRR